MTCPPPYLKEEGGGGAAVPFFLVSSLPHKREHGTRSGKSGSLPCPKWWLRFRLPFKTPGRAPFFASKDGAQIFT